MYEHVKLSKDLREALLEVIAGSCTPASMNRLIAVAHALASSFLASKPTNRSLQSMYGLNLSDLAYDCIADLFTQNEAGHYLQLESYFYGISLATARDEEILAHLRRLVFSKVNQGVFRLYSEADPSLAKILRNIKLAVSSLKNFEETERFGESCIRPGLCDTLEYKPPFDKEDLEKTFFSSVTGNELIPDLLAKLSMLLREQNEHCRILPLVAVGMLFRSAYEMKELSRTESEPANETLVSADAVSIIERACAEVKKQTQVKYADRGKVANEVFDVYFKVIHEDLCAKFLGKDGHEESLFDGMQYYLPGMNKKEYLAQHRNKVEYLLKLVHKKALKELKKI